MFKKFNWRHGIILALAGFILFILFMILVFPQGKQNAEVISDHYYEDELAYQDVLVGNLMITAFRTKVLKVIPVIMIILGTLFILRGLQLNIPYISPPANSLQINGTHKQMKMNEPTCH